MFAKPAPAPASKKAPEPVEKYAATTCSNLDVTNRHLRPVEPAKPEESIEPPTVEPEAPASQPAIAEPEVSTPVESAPVEEPEVNVTPSKDELTENNLEQLPDTSAPAPTATAASTAASSWDPRSTASSTTPYSALQQNQPQAIRPPTSGFQASALKATVTSGRTPSYPRRVLDQEEAVRMPGNREVDRAAVQFGAFSLNGTGDEDVDGEREEPETRAQPPQHSPVAPRAALPPAPQQPVTASESFPTPKQSAGLPAAVHPSGKFFLVTYYRPYCSDTFLAAPGLPSPQSLSSAQGKFPTAHILLHANVHQVHPNNHPKEMPLSTNMVDTDSLVPKNHLHCLKSHMMHSANRLLPRKVHLRATQANKPRRSHSNSPDHSHPHQMTSPHTTQRTHNNAMLTTAIISNSMDCSKVLRASRMAPLNDHTVDTVDLRLKELLKQLNKLHHVMPPLAKEAAITLQIQLPRLSSKELAKARLSQVSHNSLRPATTTHTATLTTPARIMLHT